MPNTSAPSTIKGICPDARFVRSPFHDERPEPSDISLIVIHGISLPPEQFGGDYVEQLFLGTLNAEAHPYFAQIAHLKVSSHFYIKRSGELLQFVNCERRAWHAGVSCFEGRERCNDYAIGIELEGSDVQAYDERQYPVLSSLTHWLLGQYPRITIDRIVGHEHIAPGRKTDPGPFFDWRRFRETLLE